MSTARCFSVTDSGLSPAAVVTRTFSKGSSDGKTFLLVVNPKTPVIWCETVDDWAQFYTTPAKAYCIPKIHGQTTYLTDGVAIGLANIMNDDPVYYRFDQGTFKQVDGPM